MRQWIEIIAHNQTYTDIEDTFEIIHLDGKNVSMLTMKVTKIKMMPMMMIMIM